ncbi:hypothetical protein ACLQ16_04015 [Streptomyces albidoflavus]|uniref:hypothetical protein n=1 Tax=Streptomyces albidoflavus TaxID=1886 RepID=UPI000A1CC7A3|nr:hypothetical protein [Streptomyces albidoflavus]
MRQSTAHKTQTWMDLERAVEARLHPDQVRVEPDPYGFLAAMRRGHIERTVARLRAKGRMPRVCLYALSVGGQEPRHSLNAAENYAVGQCWQVGVGQTYTDHRGATDPVTRPGWCSVREQVKAGYADGVVVVTASDISPHVDEYRQEIDWFGHHLGFIDLVISEVQKDRP